MRAPLGDLLEHVLAGEPALADEVDAVFRRADRLRRRRTRLLLAGGAVIAGTVVLAGYMLTMSLLPAHRAPQPSSAQLRAAQAQAAQAQAAQAQAAQAQAAQSRAGGVGSAAAVPSPSTPSAVPVPSAIADQVLSVLAPAVDAGHLRIVPREPARGFGWRQYSVLTPGGQPRGTIEVAVYARPDWLCFPRHKGRSACAPIDQAKSGLDYVRYNDSDPAWQVNETIARRITDGRTVALMATGERDAADRAGGRPALSGHQIEQLATDLRLMDAFGAKERCDGPPAEACPIFKVPVPE